MKFDVTVIPHPSCSIIKTLILRVRIAGTVNKDLLPNAFIHYSLTIILNNFKRWF